MDHVRSSPVIEVKVKGQNAACATSLECNSTFSTNSAYSCRQ